MKVIKFYKSLHGPLQGRGTGTTTIEAKLAQQRAYIEQVPFYGIFMDLQKVYDAMDRDRYLQILKGYRVGPNILRRIKYFWDEAVLVCRASGYYGETFPTGCRATQRHPLSP